MSSLFSFLQCKIVLASIFISKFFFHESTFTSGSGYSCVFNFFFDIFVSYKTIPKYRSMFCPRLISLGKYGLSRCYLKASNPAEHYLTLLLMKQVKKKTSPNPLLRYRLYCATSFSEMSCKK